MCLKFQEANCRALLLVFSQAILTPLEARSLDIQLNISKSEGIHSMEQAHNHDLNATNNLKNLILGAMASVCEKR
ncbi:hypothetical protein A946_02775 [Methylacidiphilum kamchatkense Kam1]|uniref:Uncharacterized protein n=1 Tax=Methylacidiphilum kamchatkense Kam1 TaxID=1202785 RepID=A0ABR4ZXZ4_9BACT|nr:hypothetical protein [Methylacidiphilum kamchatkense]KIE58991.1 hypothetical protein A946_02775 [Methylacidiphilum kamchatkense Kam1]